MIEKEGIKFIHIDAVNFVDFPVGGTLSFSRQLISQYKEKVAIVGLVTNNTDPVGKWFVKEINDISYLFFGIGRFKKSDKKPFIPLRLQTLFCLFFFLPRIRSLQVRNIFTQSPHFLFALNVFKWESLCFCFAGIANSVTHSRYKYLRALGLIYEKNLFKILKKKASVILAAADHEAIKNAIERTENILNEKNITSFPTRFDHQIFSPADKNYCRDQLHIDHDEILLLTTGRLCWVKGWQLLIDATMELYSDEKYRKVRLVFAGEGEDKTKIESYNPFLSNKNIIRLVGKLSHEEVMLYLNAADVFVMGSHFEGWPTSLVEALACGCAIVTTNVSAAKEIVLEGSNGYILNGRNPFDFAKLIKKALELKNVKEYSMENRDKFSVEHLKDDLDKLWLSTI